MPLLYVPDGPVPDTRLMFNVTPVFEPTVGPTRVIARCDTEFALLPELVDGIALGFPIREWNEVSSSWSVKWVGSIRTIDIEVGYAGQVGEYDQVIWAAAAFSLLPVFAELWATDPQGYVWPRFSKLMPSYFPATEPLIIQLISEWVVLSDMFPAVTRSHLII